MESFGFEFSRRGFHEGKANPLQVALDRRLVQTQLSVW
jgi:hypothetical protein